MGSTGSQSNQFNSQSSSVSSADYSSLVAQIIAALRPSIALSVQEALEASRVTTTQVTSVNQGGFNPNAFGSSGSSTSSSFQGSSSSSGSSSFSGSSSVSVSGSSALSGIFGDVKWHNVKIESPQYNIEYNTK